MIMGSARALPVRLVLPKTSATIAVWNARSIPGHTMRPDQVAVFDKAGASVVVPRTSVAVVLSGSVTVAGAASTVHAQFLNMLQIAGPYADPADEVVGSGGRAEWANAFRVGQSGGTAVTVAMPVVGSARSGATLTVPAAGVVVVAPSATAAGKGLVAAAAHHSVSVRLDDAGWGAATSIGDGKYQMVRNGVARTRYPGWNDSWPWYCQGPGRGCVRAVVAETATDGWLVVESGSGGSGLTMPDFARILARLGAKQAMGFDSNSHADFWRAGANPIDAFGYEPASPEATMLAYH
jgi:Phosphodiester glycosidase